jgi:hypothetical protein
MEDIEFRITFQAVVHTVDRLISLAIDFPYSDVIPFRGNEKNKLKN